VLEWHTDKLMLRGHSSRECGLIWLVSRSSRVLTVLGRASREHLLLTHARRGFVLLRRVEFLLHWLVMMVDDSKLDHQNKNKK
jgi:hypothetical protein